MAASINLELPSLIREDTPMTDPSAALLALPLERRVLLTAGAGLWSTAALPEAGVGAVTMADGPMGIASGRVDERDVSVLTPCGTALAASWDQDLVRRVGALVAEEARRLDVDVVLAPNLNLPRSPLAGRAFELFSEDPLLTGVLGAAWIMGLQGRGVAASPKHLVGNDSETNRNTMNAVIGAEALREVYLLPFEMAAQAGAFAMLAAYNRLNGYYCTEHEELLTQIVKGEWGFDGAIMSDWFGVQNGLACAKAGLDLEMPGPPRGGMGAALEKAVLAGEVDEDRIDDAATRVSRLAGRVSRRLELAPLEPTAPLLIEAAAAGFVLLKNEGDILPLNPRAQSRLAVIGPNAAAPCYQGGTFAKIAVRPDASTPIEALRARFSDRPVAFEAGVDPVPRLPPMPVRPFHDLGDGALGMTVDYFDSHDLDAAPLFSETRNTNSLTWFAMPGGASPSTTGAVRASGVYTPKVSGDHQFYAGATGPVRLLIDGERVLEKTEQPPASDLMGVLKAGEADSVCLPLTAGKPVSICVELRYSPFRAQGLWYGVREPDDPTSMLARAQALAASAAEVVLVVGESADSGVESRDRSTTKLEGRQIELIERVCAVNPNTVVIVNAAHAIDLSWAHLARAVMMTWFPGEMFGEALAAVLAGDLEPGGRLPVTFARNETDYPAFGLTPDAQDDVRYAEGWRIGYRSFQSRGITPLYALGEGRGYTQFGLLDAAYAGREGDAVTLQVKVENIGGRSGKAVLQAYISDARDENVFSLAGVACVWVDSGQTVVTALTLAPRAFQIWDERLHGWSTPKMDRLIRVGLSSLGPFLDLTPPPASE